MWVNQRIVGDPALAGRNLMREVRMYVTAWSNGRPLRTGAGYGIRLSVGDRDRFFDPDWSDVSVDVADGEPVLVPLSSSFWRSCPELRSAAIGQWLLRNALAPWPRGAPPTLVLSPAGTRRFHLRLR
jgi:hypothetical protein